MSATDAGGVTQENKQIVMIAIDRSKQAEYAFQWYVENSHRKTDDLTLVHIPETATVEASKGVRMPAGELHKMKEKEKKETDEMVTKYKALMDAAGITGHYKTIYGKPGEAIVAAATELHATYVVIGTRGMGSVRRTIMGSVSDYVLHHAHCPVIVCRK